jgi:hypothetical protein
MFGQSHHAATATDPILEGSIPEGDECLRSPMERKKEKNLSLLKKGSVSIL